MSKNISKMSKNIIQETEIKHLDHGWDRGVDFISMKSKLIN